MKIIKYANDRYYVKKGWWVFSSYLDNSFGESFWWMHTGCFWELEGCFSSYENAKRAYDLANLSTKCINVTNGDREI